MSRPKTKASRTRARTPRTKARISKLPSQLSAVGMMNSSPVAALILVPRNVFMPFSIGHDTTTSEIDGFLRTEKSGRKRLAILSDLDLLGDRRYRELIGQFDRLLVLDNVDTMSAMGIRVIDAIHNNTTNTWALKRLSPNDIARELMIEQNLANDLSASVTLPHSIRREVPDSGHFSSVWEYLIGHEGSMQAQAEVFVTRAMEYVLGDISRSDWSESNKTFVRAGGDPVASSSLANHLRSCRKLLSKVIAGLTQGVDPRAIVRLLGRPEDRLLDELIWLLERCKVNKNLRSVITAYKKPVCRELRKADRSQFDIDQALADLYRSSDRDPPRQPSRREVELELITAESVSTRPVKTGETTLNRLNRLYTRRGKKPIKQLNSKAVNRLRAFWKRAK